MVLVSASLVSAEAQSVPALINYQGRLLDGTNLVNGTVGLELSLFTAASGGTLLYTDSNDVAVADGLYATIIGDGTLFGDLRTALEHPAVFVQIRVNGTDLSPRDRLVSAAYAIVPGSRGVNSIITHPTASVGAGSNNVVRMANAFVGGGLRNQIFTNTGFFTPNSAILGGADNMISNAGHAAIVAGENNLLNSSASDSVVLGGNRNEILGNASGGAIAGGRWNRISGLWNMISGGDSNLIESSQDSVIAGGRFHVISDGFLDAIIGGDRNTISNAGLISVGNVIIGGNDNFNLAQSDSVIAGGDANVIRGGAIGGFIGGGGANVIESNVSAAVIFGGGNRVSANFGMALGGNARVFHNNTFIWSGSTAVFTSTAPRQFLVSAPGGMAVNTNDPAGSALRVAGRIETTAGGLKFPDGTIQLTAATGGAGGVTNVMTGVGLTGGPITSEGTIQVANGGITMALLAPDAVTTTNIVDGTVTNVDLADGAVTADKLADGAALAEVADDDGTGSGLDADLLDGLDSAAFALSSHTHGAADIVSGTLADARLSINVTKLGSSIESSEITDQTITSADIANNSIVGSSEIALNSISNENLGVGSVTGGTVRDGSLTAVDFASNIFWQLKGNAGTTVGTHFLGTIDNEPMHILVNSARRATGSRAL